MRTALLVPVLNYQIDRPVPPAIPSTDWTAMEAAENEAYCRELERALLAYELNPRNFFRLNKLKVRGLL
jgi:hypothetical protein